MNTRKFALAGAIGAFVTLGILAALAYAEHMILPGWLLVAIFFGVAGGVLAVSDQPAARPRKRRRRRKITRL